MSDLLPCPFCGAHLTEPTPMQYPTMDLARIHPGDLDQGDCPIAGWGFYDHQIGAWNNRPALSHPTMEACTACDGTGGVMEDMGDGCYVGAQCPFCSGHGFSENVEDAVWSAIMEAQGPDSTTRDYAKAALIAIARPAQSSPSMEKQP